MCSPDQLGCELGNKKFANGPKLVRSETGTFARLLTNQDSCRRVQDDSGTPDYQKNLFVNLILLKVGHSDEVQD